VIPTQTGNSYMEPARPGQAIPASIAPDGGTVFANKIERVANESSRLEASLDSFLSFRRKQPIIRLKRK
jgi:hypothetical protein